MKLAVLDLETDPFEHGQMVHPFVAGFYDGERFIIIWSKDCVKQMVYALAKENEEFCIYAHNGGRFDFWYFLSHLSGKPRIINGRIVQGFLGKHELRDSYAIMPFPLADYQPAGEGGKLKIDYDLMKAGVRDKHKDEIIQYLKRDLTSLYELVDGFHKEFGAKLTIGSAAMTEIKSRHKFSCGSGEYDAKFRKDFFYGGRNQVFRAGITSGDIRVYDVNSMYPFVMQSFLHPIGVGYSVDTRVTSNTCFVVVRGRNDGAFPIRDRSGALDFTTPNGDYCVSIHEFEAAVDTGCFKPVKILKTYGWRQRGTFDDFVSHFYEKRRVAKETGDELRKIYYKYLLNSGYGKFAQNPDNYFDWQITVYGEYPSEWHECTKSCDEECRQRWHPEYVHDGSYMIWKRPLQTKHWYNIAIGASITGAARSVLLRGIHATEQPLYCDTDSIICVGPSRVKVDASRIGCWNCEAVGTMAAIAGKKLYAIFDSNPTRLNNARMAAKAKGKTFESFNINRVENYTVKKAHKGAKLTGKQIKDIADGGEVDYASESPNFRLDGSVKFVKRTIKRTANVSKR